MQVKFGFAVLSAVVALVFAPSSNANTVISDEIVQRTHVNLNGGYFFQTFNMVQNPDNCSNTTWYRVPSGGRFAKEAFAILLASLESGERVQFNVNGCEGAYPKVTWINIYRNVPLP